MSQSFIGSIALVRRFVDGGCSWLFRQEEHILHLIQAQRLEGESYREVIEREVGWRLQIARGKDYIVSSVPRAHFQGAITHGDQSIFYVIEFFVVDLFGRKAQPVLDHDPNNLWLTNEDLLSSGPSTLPIDAWQRQLLHLTEVLGPKSL